MWTNIKGWLGIGWVVAGRLLGRAPVYFVVTLGLHWAAAKWPHAILPSADTLTDIVLAALTVHSMADAYGLVKAYLTEIAGDKMPALPARPA